MNLSYWEYKSWLSNIDFTIVGSGIVGLNCAVQLKYRFPKAKILVLEKGTLPQGASTKNAGFACFGSISEILADLENHSDNEVLQLVQRRWEGIQLLRENFGDSLIDYQEEGGYELFLEKDSALFEYCNSHLARVNKFLHPVFQDDVFKIENNDYDFKGICSKVISNSFEGQLDTGKMMKGLLKLASDLNITILNSVYVEEYTDQLETVHIKTNAFEFTSKKLLLAVNGFAGQLMQQDIRPARAQVVITKPIKNLPFKGTFHVEEGYYYFRNINNRVLLGGGRNLDFNSEETTEFGSTPLVQEALVQLLENVILSNTAFEIEQQWSGIMGIGPQKIPIVKQVSENTACGIRLGGMGIAIGTAVGNELASIF